ncbi:MAG TPA: PAS domain S-box protein, partial [Azospira sp.]|nr:PAS domain S-box protein [Azospira sp.]
MDKKVEPATIRFTSADSEWLQQVLDHLPVGVWLTDAQGRISLGNAAGQKIWGGARYVAPPDYDAYRGWWPDSGQPLGAGEWPLARAVLQGETHLGVMIDIEGFDGSRRTILSSAAPIQEAAGGQVGALVVNQDVTELKQAQDALRQESAFNNAILDTVAALVVVLDREGRIVRFNAECERLTGFTQAEVAGRHFTDFLIPEEEQAVVAGRFRQLQAGDYPNRYENHWLIRSGGRCRIAWRNTCIVDTGGQVVHVIGCGMDVTDQRQTEAALQLAQKAFDASGEAIMVTDAAGRIVSVNNAFASITGHDPESVIGATPRILRSGRHSPEFYADLWHALEQDGRWQGEIWDRRADGSVYPKWLTITAVRDGDRTTHYVALFTDISERKAHEERIRHLAEHDALTGLPNRSLLRERLGQEIHRAGRGKRDFAVLFLDLDRFKTINDSLGHEIGDELLIQVGTRLHGAVRSTDLVARLGGDEFVVLITDLEDAL